MANENHDPWALLREAEWAVAYVAAGPNALRDAKELRDRIDAALTEHDAVPPSEEPAWHMIGNPVGTLTADFGDWVLRVRWDGQDAAWDATRYGRESDEKKAKSAALAAARGMR